MCTDQVGFGEFRWNEGSIRGISLFHASSLMHALVPPLCVRCLARPPAQNLRWCMLGCPGATCEGRWIPSYGERIFVELMTSDRKLEASRGGSK